MDGNNLQPVFTFTGTKDESWFYIVHMLLEVAAVPGLKAIQHAYTSMINHDHQGLTQDLLNVRSTLERMLEMLLKMYEHCDPKVFYVMIRPFLAGSKGLPAFLQDYTMRGWTLNLYSTMVAVQHRALQCMRLICS